MGKPNAFKVSRHDVLTVHGFMEGEYVRMSSFKSVVAELERLSNGKHGKHGDKCPQCVGIVRAYQEIQARNDALHRENSALKERLRSIRQFSEDV